MAGRWLTDFRDVHQSTAPRDRARLPTLLIAIVGTGAAGFLIGFLVAVLLVA